MRQESHPPYRLGILSGIESEARTLIGKLPPSDRLDSDFQLSAATSAGARGATAALKAGGCTHLLSWGLAGGLDPSLRPGSLLLPRHVVTREQNEIPVSAEWHQTALKIFDDLGASSSPILGVENPVTTVAAKTELYRQHTSAAINAIDMESHILGQAAQDAGLEFLIIRVIVDTADTALPPAAQSSIATDGKTNILAVLRSLVAHPGQLPELIRLGRAAGKATSMLLRCADMGGPTGFGIL